MVVQATLLNETRGPPAFIGDVERATLEAPSVAAGPKEMSPPGQLMGSVCRASGTVRSAWLANGASCRSINGLDNKKSAVERLHAIGVLGVDAAAHRSCPSLTAHDVTASRH